jgi:hypothetical protein
VSALTLQFYLIEVRLLSQIWVLQKRYSDFDRMHHRLLNDLEYRAADNLPDLPPKRLVFNRDCEFIKERMKSLHKYLKFMILIYEVIESPILQRFLEIDTQFDPSYEYGSIDLELDTLRRSESDCSSLFLEMDKYTKTRLKFILRNQTGPFSTAGVNFPSINCTEILNQMTYF